MAKKAKSKAKAKVDVGSYVFLGLMLAAAIVGFIGLLIATHYSVTFGETETFTLGSIAEHFTKMNKIPGNDFSTAALTCTNIFGWIAVAGAVALVVLEALNLFGIKVPSIVKWIIAGVTIACAVAFIICSSTVCIDFYGGKEAYETALNGAQKLESKVLSLGAGSYMTLIGTAVVPALVVTKKLISK